jgi:hypothetical protein
MANSGGRPVDLVDCVQIEGVPNFFRVSDDLYRGAQPTATGMRNLKAMGINTIVNSFVSLDRTRLRHLTGCETIHMKVASGGKCLILKRDYSKGPLFLFTAAGRIHRTMCAVYRIAVQGWTKEEALREMTEGGFGFHGIWDNLIQWINRLDIDKIKQRAGIDVIPLSFHDPKVFVHARNRLYNPYDHSFYLTHLDQ